MGSASRQAELWGARVKDWAEVSEGQTRPLKEAVLQALSLRQRNALAASGYVSSELQDSTGTTERLCIDGCVFDR